MTDRELIAHIDIKVAGNSLSEDIIDKLREVHIDTSLALPGMFEIIIDDEDLSITDGSTFDLGKEVEILFKSDNSNAYESVIKGEITAVEPHFEPGMQVSLTIRGYDKSHRLNRGTITKTFVEQTDSDIVNTIASAAGLSASVDATSEVRPSVFQHGLTNLEFLQFLAKRNGYKVWVDDRTLYFKKGTHTTSQIELTWGDNLIEFAPRVSISRQVEKVIVKGWDVKQKKEIVGQATSSTTHPSINVGGSGGTVAKSKISSAEYVEVTRPVSTQAEADNLAQALLDEINGGFVEAEGLARGNGQIVAGTKILVNNIGSKFSGTYAVTSATHHYSKGIYEVSFKVEGVAQHTISDFVGKSDSAGNGEQSWTGVSTAIVTNNNDPDKMGRVKVKYPWIAGDLESGWARVVSVGAGPEVGLHWTPTINDEVIVAFQHGAFDYPIVIGGVWNGKDKPVLPTPVANGKVANVQLKTVKGHMLDFDEENEVITLTDSTGKTLLKMDGQNELITIECSKDILMKTGGKFDIDATGDVTIKSKANVKIESTQNMDLKATGNLTEEATGNVDIKATGNLTAKATAMGTFEASGMGTVKAGGILTVKGSLVNIN